MEKKKILFDPYPRSVELLFCQEDLQRLSSLFELIIWEDGKMPPDKLEKTLPEVFAIVGQTDLPVGRLKKARHLKAIINVEGNFLQNIDYSYCLNRGIYVLNAGVAFSEAVAEMALGFAISLARNIPYTDRKFREKEERYGRLSNRGCFLLKGAKTGIIGFGNIGRALVKLLTPFRMEISVYDPWLPDNFIREHGCQPVSLETLLKTSKIIFVLAGATTENRHMLGRKELNWIKEDSLFILTSRASLVDFEVLINKLANEKFKAALDVFPEEPLPKESKLRELDNVILSSHRAGGIEEAYKLMGEMIADDLELILKNLPPVRLQRANLETVTKMSSRPIG